MRKYDLDGNELWTRQFGSIDIDHIVGSVNGVGLGPTEVGDNDAFVMKVLPPKLVKITPGPVPVPGGRPKP